MISENVTLPSAVSIDRVATSRTLVRLAQRCLVRPLLSLWLPSPHSRKAGCRHQAWFANNWHEVDLIEDVLLNVDAGRNFNQLDALRCQLEHGSFGDVEDFAVRYGSDFATE